jgi:hypothetical protein
MKNSTKVGLAGAATMAAIGFALPTPSAQAGGLDETYPSTQQMWKDAHSVIQLDRVKLPWTGRIQYTQRDHQHGVCIETFNGTNHSIKQYGHGVPSGMYIKFCRDGNYYTNDGKPFPNMHGF